MRFALNFCRNKSVNLKGFVFKIIMITNLNTLSN